MPNLTVKVKAKDIIHGSRNSSKDCPVARAVNRKLNLTYPVSVLSDHLDSSQTQVTLPKRVTKRINRYDNKGKMKPFKFKVKVPKSWLTR